MCRNHRHLDATDKFLAQHATGKGAETEEFITEHVASRLREGARVAGEQTMLIEWVFAQRCAEPSLGIEDTSLPVLNEHSAQIIFPVCVQLGWHVFVARPEVKSLLKTNERLTTVSHLCVCRFVREGRLLALIGEPSVQVFQATFRRSGTVVEHRAQGSMTQASVLQAEIVRDCQTEKNSSRSDSELTQLRALCGSLFFHRRKPTA